MWNRFANTGGERCARVGGGGWGRRIAKIRGYKAPPALGGPSVGGSVAA